MSYYKHLGQLSFIPNNGKPSTSHSMWTIIRVVIVVLLWKFNFIFYKLRRNSLGKQLVEVWQRTHLCSQRTCQTKIHQIHSRVLSQEMLKTVGSSVQRSLLHKLVEWLDKTCSWWFVYMREYTNIYWNTSEEQRLIQKLVQEARVVLYPVMCK